MTSTSNADQPKTSRATFLNALCMSGLIGGLVVPMASHAMPASGMNHGDDMKAMVKSMNDKMAGMTMTGNHDVDVAQMMRIHHYQGAIDIAEMKLKNGKDASMRKMAQEVTKAQKRNCDPGPLFGQKRRLQQRSLI